MATLQFSDVNIDTVGIDLAWAEATVEIGDDDGFCVVEELTLDSYAAFDYDNNPVELTTLQKAQVEKFLRYEAEEHKQEEMRDELSGYIEFMREQFG